MSLRILSTSPLVGPFLGDLGRRFPDLSIAPAGSLAWRMGLSTAEALVVQLTEPLPEADLDLAPRLRVIGTYSVGTDHLPIAACQARGIHIVNTPDVLTETTADLALALLLALTRRISEGEALVRSGTWSGWAPDQLLGTGVTGRVCGILGSGPIGRAFARRAWALGMQPAFWDRLGGQPPVDFGPGTAPRLPLEELLSQSHVISLHCPLTPETRGLLNRDRLLLLPQGACLINTARGGILDERAAMALLHTGELGGVGLDVYENEPQLDPEWLLSPRTVMTPHLGSATRETRGEMARLLCAGIGEVLGASPN
jgi:glyoxylate reductase